MGTAQERPLVLEVRLRDQAFKARTEGERREEERMRTALAFEQLAVDEARAREAHEAHLKNAAAELREREANIEAQALRQQELRARLAVLEAERYRNAVEAAAVIVKHPGMPPELVKDVLTASASSASETSND